MDDFGAPPLATSLRPVRCDRHKEGTWEGGGGGWRGGALVKKTVLASIFCALADFSPDINDIVAIYPTTPQDLATKSNENSEWEVTNIFISYSSVNMTFYLHSHSVRKHK